MSAKNSVEMWKKLQKVVMTPIKKVYKKSIKSIDNDYHVEYNEGISKRNAPQKLKATDLTQKIIWLRRAQRV